MIKVLPQEDFVEANNLEVVVNGQSLFAAKLSDSERRAADIIIAVIRIIGLALMAYAAFLVFRNDAVGALNLGMLGAVFFFGTMIGLSQFGSTPRRITLDPDTLTFVDHATGIQRTLERGLCTEARCGESKTGCGVYISYPENRLELLVDGLTCESAHKVVTLLNEQLCTST
jgi:hypothetical protein